MLDQSPLRTGQNLNLTKCMEKRINLQNHRISELIKNWMLLHTVKKKSTMHSPYSIKYLKFVLINELPLQYSLRIIKGRRQDRSLTNLLGGGRPEVRRPFTSFWRPLIKTAPLYRCLLHWRPFTSFQSPLIKTAPLYSTDTFLHWRPLTNLEKRTAQKSA